MKKSSIASLLLQLGLDKLAERKYSNPVTCRYSVKFGVSRKNGDAALYFTVTQRNGNQIHYLFPLERVYEQTEEEFLLEGCPSVVGDNLNYLGEEEFEPQRSIDISPLPPLTPTFIHSPLVESESDCGILDAWEPSPPRPPKPPTSSSSSRGRAASSRSRIGCTALCTAAEEEEEVEEQDILDMWVVRYDQQLQHNSSSQPDSASLQKSRTGVSSSFGKFVPNADVKQPVEKMRMQRAKNNRLRTVSSDQADEEQLEPGSLEDISSFLDGQQEDLQAHRRELEVRGSSSVSPLPTAPAKRGRGRPKHQLAASAETSLSAKLEAELELISRERNTTVAHSHEEETSPLPATEKQSNSHRW